MGQVLIHSASDFDLVAELGEYFRGDRLDLTLDFRVFRPVLVENDGRFLDVEYRVMFCENQTILSLDEIYSENFIKKIKPIGGVLK